MDRNLVSTNADSLERYSWLIVFIGLILPSLPSYNIAIGFWGVYCSYSKHSRATFGCVACTALSLIMDIVILSSSGFSGKFIFSMLPRCITLYSAACLFAALGGTASMNMDGSRILNESAYETLVGSSASVNAERGLGGGGYYPPNNVSNSQIVEESGRG